MAGFLIRLFIVALGLWLASLIVPGFEIRGLWTLLFSALLLGVVNAVIRPLVVLITLPVTVLTLGFFLFAINAGMIGLVAWLFDDFTISGFWAAVFGSIVVGITGWLASAFIGPRGNVEVIVVRRSHGNTTDKT
ncbi:MAG: phage holin family protein [Pseudomonadota bacterium]